MALVSRCLSCFTSYSPVAHSPAQALLRNTGNKKVELQRLYFSTVPGTSTNTMKTSAHFSNNKNTWRKCVHTATIGQGWGEHFYYRKTSWGFTSSCNICISLFSLKDHITQSPLGHAQVQLRHIPSTWLQGQAMHLHLAYMCNFRIFKHKLMPV